MKIKTTQGHLTSTNVKHIKALINAGIYEGFANRIGYKIENLGEGNHKITTTQNESNDWGKMVQRTHSSHCIIY